MIISDPSNPWIAGIADIFTAEFFRLCHQRLTPNGIACIWLPAYNIDDQAFRSVVRTFQSVFPNTTIWEPKDTDFLLLGSRQPLAVDHKVLNRRINERTIAADLDRIGIKSTAAFLARFVMPAKSAAQFARSGPLHTDDNALLEFSSPRNMTRHGDGRSLFDSIQAYRQIDLSFLVYLQSGHGESETLSTLKGQATQLLKARTHVLRSEVYLLQNRASKSIAELVHAMELNPCNTRLKMHVHRIREDARDAVEQIQFTKAARLYGQLLKIRPREADFHYELASVLIAQDHLEAATDHYTQAAALTPQDPDPHFRLAEIAQQQGNVEAVIKHSRQVLQRQPDSAEAHNNLANALRARGRLNEAIHHAQETVKLKPDSAIAHNNLANIYFLQDKLDKAIRGYREALRLDSNLPEANSNLAWILTVNPDPTRRDVPEATRLAEKACELTHRRNAPMLEKLSVVYAANGHFSKALTAAKTALDLAMADENLPLTEKLLTRLSQYLKQYRTHHPPDSNPHD